LDSSSESDSSPESDSSSFFGVSSCLAFFVGAAFVVDSAFLFLSAEDDDVSESDSEEFVTAFLTFSSGALLFFLSSELELPSLSLSELSSAFF